MKDSYVSGIASVIVAVVLGSALLLSAKEIRIGLEKGAGQRVAQGVNAPAPPQLQPAPPPDPAGDPSKINIAGSPYEGKKNAPVTIIVCSDFQCPFSARFFNDTQKELRKNEIKDGKVKLVFKNFPLPFHQYAEKAAEAAECANQQEKFWQMHDLLFSSGGRLDIDSLKSYAKEIGLDRNKFDHCLDSGETAGIVSSDKAQCAAAGVQGTPTFFINGKMLVGAQPYEQFKNLIGESKPR
jgi:protein-disulfide isomerase